uniref:Uncharacterized protein n=1 Tax=Timema douglasi TaxID=61478 RepID=A0A7R8VSS4_TIMDO|nr:unnamed protein product [Timema douglasi]
MLLMKRLQERESIGSNKDSFLRFTFILSVSHYPSGLYANVFGIKPRYIRPGVEPGRFSPSSVVLCFESDVFSGSLADEISGPELIKTWSHPSALGSAKHVQLCLSFLRRSPSEPPVRVSRGPESMRASRWTTQDAGARLAFSPGPLRYWVTRVLDGAVCCCVSCSCACLAVCIFCSRQLSAKAKQLLLPSPRKHMVLPGTGELDVRRYYPRSF